MRASSLHSSAEPALCLKAPQSTDSFLSVSTTTNDSTRRPTSNISRGRKVRGFGFNWRYDSGLVAGAVPFSDGGDVDVSGLTPNQQFEAGLFCGSVRATPTAPISSSLGANLCPGSMYGSTLVSIPTPGTENDDSNPPRIAPRHLFDLAVGDDNLFRGDKYKWSLQLTAINLTNKTALYNFLSTFSGTHYVTPRSYTAELGFHF